MLISKKEIDVMTVRELRSILFEVENQDLTIKELRAILFNIDAQDEKISTSELKRLTCKGGETAWQ